MPKGITQTAKELQSPRAQQGAGPRFSGKLYVKNMEAGRRGPEFSIRRISQSQEEQPVTAATPFFTLAELEDAAQLVRPIVSPTPQYAWPRLARLVGCDVRVKHENHTPIGAFKVRGGIVYMDALRRSGKRLTGVVTATRGNHGQSISFSASRAGIPATIYVPHGNAADQNAAISVFGATVVEFGKDFDEARIECMRVAGQQDLHFVPPFHRDLAKGVATYALELLRGVDELDAVYVPIGMGSGICGLITARDLLGLRTDVIGVVARNAPAMALSFEAGKRVTTESARTFADGLATREPHEEALAIISRGAARIVQLSEDEIAEAVRLYFHSTHHVAEGAGAAPLAALMQERSRMARKKSAVILTGSNIDAVVYWRILSGETPKLG
jgi:threonine dehydratase